MLHPLLKTNCLIHFPDIVAHDQISSTRNQDKSAASPPSQAVSAKLDDDSLKSANGIISSDYSLAQPSTEALQKLKRSIHLPQVG